MNRYPSSIERGDVFGGKPASGVEHRADLGVPAGDLLAADEQLAGLPGPSTVPSSARICTSMPGTG